MHRTIMICIGLLGELAAMQRVAAQNRALPGPTGPHAVGVVSLVLVDRSRAETFTRDTADRREVPIRVWYPAERGATRTDAYMPDSALWLQSESGSGAQLFARTRATHTHGVAGARPLTNRSWPIVLLSPGNTFAPEYYTTFAEELASHGFVVAGLAVPYEAPVARLSRGHVVRAAERPSDIDAFSFARRTIDVRAADLQFVLGELARTSSLRSVLPGMKVDQARAIVIGHSRGGVSAMESCKLSDRFRACLNLDGGVLGGPFYDDSSAAGPRAPTLWLQAYHPPPGDSLLATWKMSRMQWDSFDIRANRLLQRARGGAWRVVLPDSSHFQFSDLDWLLAKDSASAAAARKSLLAAREVIREFAIALIRGAGRQFEQAVAHVRKLSFSTLR